jgi:hypothetical protein
VLELPEQLHDKVASGELTPALLLRVEEAAAARLLSRALAARS